MKIILSPSKLQGTNSLFNNHKAVINPAKSKALRGKLSAMSFNQLQRFFGLKAPTAQAVYDIYRSDHLPSGDPFATYTGIVFKEINGASYDARQLDYLLTHGTVLSAMYGVLQANMGIQPYRLDMTKKLANIDLYAYWQEEIDVFFKPVDCVVNLASREFSKMLKHYQGRMVDIFFEEEQSDGTFKIITVRTKQARGLMFDYMISHCVQDIEMIKHFSEAGYHYNDKISTEHRWHFIRPYAD